MGIFNGSDLCGIALIQQISLRNVSSFGERDTFYKKRLREIVFRKLASNIVVLGNNMLTGQNAFALSPKITPVQALAILGKAVDQVVTDIERSGEKVHLKVYKDFLQSDVTLFSNLNLDEFTIFTTQPNMIFDVNPQWQTINNYISDLTKKYRDQYKRARKKADGVEKRKLDVSEIERLQPVITQLYMTVARQAPFNTFYLTQDHFLKMKQLLGDNFLFYGYFFDSKLIGFSTLIKNGSAFDTYFLGYDDTYQREKMLYLNMLYDMISYAMKKRFKSVVMARTALEIKSSVGASKIDMYGYIKHSNYLVNKLMPWLFRYFEPALEWNQRHPFKEQQSSAVEIIS